ncbi:MAG: glycosyltransferase family 2 protein [Candidatus Omnitrophica bacterium]|nr:glycosyltransferase family 2 protein [Smithellaceae bacterium]MDD5670899.1 glycosyltransferase family 2 protein [Candidatus Omnitrophota bacterium]
MLLQILFWLILAVIFYTYAGYALILFLLSRVIKKPVSKDQSTPKVSVIISAFNEEKNIEKKLNNLLAIDYPMDALEILIGSDGAWDKTDQIISHFPSSQVRFYKFIRNLGKPSVLNDLVKEAHGAIVVFTDVRQEIHPKSIRALVANFADPAVGCVSGELYFKAETEAQKGTIGRGMGVYWNYEKFLRKRESEIGSMLGATGAIYAIRRKLFPYIPDDILVDDMFVPLAIISQGYRAVFESEARAFDRPSEEGREEFTRKVRTLAGNFQLFVQFPHLFHPFKSPVAWQFFSHRLLRVTAPFFLILLFVINLFLVTQPFYLICFVLQSLFYGVAAGEAMKKGRNKRGIGYIAYTFCLLNAAAFAGFFRFLRGGQKAAWQKAYK